MKINNNELLKNIFTILAAVVPFIMAFFGQNNPALAISAAVIGGIVIVLIILLWIFSARERRLKNGASIDASNRKVVNHLKLLLLLCKKNERNLKLHKEKAAEIYFHNVLSSNKKSISKEIIVAHGNEYFKQVLLKENKLNNQSLVDDLKACDSLISCLNDIDKVLLQVNQLKSRYDFGKYIVKHSLTYGNYFKAKVDMIGWTSILMNYNIRAEEQLNEAIDELETLKEKFKGLDFSKASEDELNAVYDVYIYEQRAYRHLSASPTIRRKNLNVAIKNIDSAKENLQVLVDNIKYFSKSKQNEIKRNECGVIYGYAETYYDLVKSSIKKGNLQQAKDYLLKSLNYLDDVFEQLSKLEKCDDQRMVKANLLKNQVFFQAFLLFDKSDKSFESEHMKPVKKLFEEYDGSEDCSKDNLLDASLSNSLNILKNSIYGDNGTETYIQQRVLQAYKKVGSIYGIKYGK